MTEITNYYEFSKTDETPKQLVILLHGLGSNGQDLISLAPLWSHSLPDAHFVSPDAPFDLDMMPGMMGAYQWFSLADRAPEKMLAGAEKAFPILEGFIEAMLKKFNVAPENLALVGFSQGTMMSLYTAPRLSFPIAGVLGYSGALIGGDGLAQDPDEFHKFPVHLIHGEADDVVPVQARTIAQETLAQAGYTVSGHTTPHLAHSIDEKGVESGGEFLKQILGGA